MRDQAPEPPDERSQRDRMLAGELYIADDPQLAADNLRALTLTSQFNTSDPADAQARQALLRELLGSLGEGTVIRPPCTATTAPRPTSERGASSTSDASCWMWPRSGSATTSRLAPTCSS
jgi:Maltose acetyltransferase